MSKESKHVVKCKKFQHMEASSPSVLDPPPDVDLAVR